MKKKWANKLDDWIFNSWEIAPDNLALCRIVYALFNLFFLFHFNFSWIATYPDAFYHAKPGITFFFDGFPSKWVLNFFNIALTILNFLLLFGIRTKLVSVLTTLMLIVSFSFVFAFGNTYHIILWVIFPAIMAKSNWGAALSLDALKPEINPVESWPITFMSILTGFAFFTSGFSKLLGGWLRTGNSASWQYFHIVREKTGRDLYFSDYLAGIQNSVFWEAADWLVVCFEIGFLLAVFTPKSFRFFICLAVLFHFFNMLMLNISFSIHIVIFLVFVNWNLPEIKNSKTLTLIRQNIHGFSVRQNIYLISFWITTYLIIFFVWGNHSRVDKIVPVEYPVYVAGLGVCFYFFYKKTREI